jgi:hypothetical protein
LRLAPSNVRARTISLNWQMFALRSTKLGIDQESRHEEKTHSDLRRFAARAVQERRFGAGMCRLERRIRCISGTDSALARPKRGKHGRAEKRPQGCGTIAESIQLWLFRRKLTCWQLSKGEFRALLVQYKDVRDATEKLADHPPRHLSPRQ